MLAQSLAGGNPPTEDMGVGLAARATLPRLFRPKTSPPAFSSSVVSRLRTLGAARTLLLLAILALLTHFIADSGLAKAAAKKDRFDFSGAICTTGKHAKSDAKSEAKPAGSGKLQTLAVKAPPSQHQHHAGGECCELCCGAGAAPLASALPSHLPAAEPGRIAPVAITASLEPAPQWAPQAARAPPFRF